MTASRTILVQANIAGEPPTWTSGSIAAIDQAGQLAARDRLQLHLLTSLDDGPVETAALLESNENPLAVHQGIQKLHADVAAQFMNQQVEVNSHLLHDSSPSAFVQHVQDHRPRVVFLGADGENFEPTKIEEILERSRSDVWMAVPDAFDRDVLCLVVVDDLSDSGQRALRTAVSLGQAFHSRLLVVHALPLDCTEQDTTAVEEQIQSRLFQTDFRTLDQGTRLFVETGGLADVLEQAVREFDASLVIMSPSATIALAVVGPKILAANCSLYLLPGIEHAERAIPT
ncbi:universal stress protein [Planctomicrobium piriforme]|uniref:Universal stress protein family protein n=1 Tax=Planctomicrobium piriforme TaxID=1576369 RepID=A0A1I3PBJ0_9PLAN|nr:universal stress protein [Planctomicrobium piriforme]SFJ18781.1 Universal stress protein family protein [Planctomicrobium piriforme]